MNKLLILREKIHTIRQNNNNVLLRQLLHVSTSQALHQGCTVAKNKC